jgi:hypothetical protein
MDGISERADKEKGEIFVGGDFCPPFSGLPFLPFWIFPHPLLINSVTIN